MLIVQATIFLVLLVIEREEGPVLKFVKLMIFNLCLSILIVAFPCMLTIIQLLFQKNAHVFYY
jgi:hypothetical protein